MCIRDSCSILSYDSMTDCIWRGLVTMVAVGGDFGPEANADAPDLHG